MVLRTDFVIPITKSTTPVGTRMKVVGQTARPTPIATTPPTSQRQAMLTPPTIAQYRSAFASPDFQVHYRTLAHHGVPFLDELTEFRRDAVEALRQPLEDGRVVVTRVAGSVEFPARFTMVTATTDETRCLGR